METITYLRTVMSWLRSRLAYVHDESGSPTLETMIIAGVLSAAALAAAAILVAMIMKHANDIQ